MATIAYFDCFHGAAGDMLLASLLDTGLDKGDLDAVLATLPLAGYTLEHHQVVSHHIRGSRVKIHITEQPITRSWADIRSLLETSSLPDQTRTQSLSTFERLAQAEAVIHGVEREEVHFHEVGSIDSIVDIVGICAALELLGVTHVFASSLPIGSGWIDSQHDKIPVPAPATLSLLAEVKAPLIPSASNGELITPTAAAILASLATFRQPAMQIQHIGYGFGKREYDRPNGLRVWIGQSLGSFPISNHSTAAELPPSRTNPMFSSSEIVTEIRCNLDDATGEIVAYTIEQLFAAGALDAWVESLGMKKGRPGVQLCCLCYPDSVMRFAEMMMRETPTLGVRWHTMERLVCERQSIETDTPWGRVPLKQKILDGLVVASSPEYEACARLARTYHIPLQDVYAAALSSAGIGGA